MLSEQITQSEVSALVAAASDPSSLFGTGIRLAGVKFMTIRADDELIAGKKGVRACSNLCALCMIDKRFYRRMAFRHTNQHRRY